jgi:hypothetical protein
MRVLESNDGSRPDRAPPCLRAKPLTSCGGEAFVTSSSPAGATWLVCSPSAMPAGVPALRSVLEGPWPIS